MRSCAAALLAVLLVPAGGAWAQGPGAPPTAVLTGTVYDSVTGRFLPGATVRLDDGVAVATTDTTGRFTLRAPPGEYRVSFDHRSLSGWGLLHHPLVLRLEAGRTVSAALATASAPTVLARTCGTEGGVVGGRVLDLLTLVPLAGSYVQVDTREGRGPRGRTLNTAGDGSWYVCVPDPDMEVEVRASMGDVRGAPLRLRGGGAVRSRDLYLRASEPAGLEGLVLDGSTGTPLDGASVEVLGTRLRTLTGGDGRFRFRGVPPGGIRLAVERIGYGRKVTMVRAEGGSTARVTFELFTEAVALDSVVVTVEGGVTDRRRLATRFDGLTREEIEAILPRSVGFDDLLRNANIPGLRVRQMEFMRSSGFREPGVCIELMRRSASAGRQCDMLEVYLNDIRLSEPEVFLATLDPGAVDRFQVLTSANAGIQYLGTPRSRNGILLIWTRSR